MPRYALLFALVAGSASFISTVDNVNPRVDQYGHIVNAHDGSVVRFEGYDGLYFMYGTVYENCTQHGPQCDGCGYSPNLFSLYTTPDLVHFTLISANILPEASKDNTKINYWMPVVYYNARTAVFVMQYWSGRCGFAAPCADIATSTTPYGPFKMVPPLVLHGGTPSSQMGFFVDPLTSAGYVKYNTGAPQHHVVEALADDWLSTTGQWSIVFWKPSFAWMEGGGMFRRGELVYYMTGTVRCLCRAPLACGHCARVLACQSQRPFHAPPLPYTPNQPARGRRCALLDCAQRPGPLAPRPGAPPAHCALRPVRGLAEHEPARRPGQ